MGHTQQALRFQIDRLAEIGTLYFWTFTFRGVHSVSDACGRWSGCNADLVRELPAWVGVRVFEMHETHGLHIHCIVAGRVPVARIRAISCLWGFGRIHVQRVERNPYYVAKYTTKAGRPECLTGRRIWAAFGMSKPHASRCAVVRKWSRVRISRAGARGVWNERRQRCQAAANHARRVRVRDVGFDSLPSRAVKFAARFRESLHGMGRMGFSDLVLRMALECGDDLRGACSGVQVALAGSWAPVRYRLRPAAKGVPLAPWERDDGARGGCPLAGIPASPSPSNLVNRGTIFKGVAA